MTREEREAINARIIELLDKLNLIPADGEQPEQIAAQSARPDREELKAEIMRDLQQLGLVTDTQSAAETEKGAQQ